MTEILLAILIIGVAIAGLAVKIIFKKDGEFRGTCATNNPMLKNEIGECTVCGSQAGESCQKDEEEAKMAVGNA